MQRNEFLSHILKLGFKCNLAKDNTYIFYLNDNHKLVLHEKYYNLKINNKPDNYIKFNKITNPIILKDSRSSKLKKILNEY